MSKRLWQKQALNCGRKRMYSRKDVIAQQKAREMSGQTVRVYKCPKCSYWHTTSMRKTRNLTPFSKVWNKL